MGKLWPFDHIASTDAIFSTFLTKTIVMYEQKHTKRTTVTIRKFTFPIYAVLHLSRYCYFLYFPETCLIHFPGTNQDYSKLWVTTSSKNSMLISSRNPIVNIIFR